MLVTMLTAMYMIVKVVESISFQFESKPDPLPYMVSQPLPWQIHSVSHSRKNSRAEEFNGHRRNSMGVYRKKYVSMAIASTSMAIPCFLSCSDSNATNGTAVPPLSPVEVEKAAATIQTHFRRFQEKKHKNGK
ncbi:uncharacterized protein [Eucyclogobius newberryi]|uniref:uncharacterized protein isoform X1 n=1 Tax=Eucyclogobius newberryi TaxID=166745 RepID=UPI003B5B80A6